ncbi:hypothetical protein B0H66DRAFT_589185 [Apodospora peruviana]|uniref:Uncharacterized protein n=1 Tax=Apodospora peruviana TaxID=516989 RepID=A0AAE0IK29_9PEZI|nr:hypothetical protein B0H66DRAFT_589185 [Apodospora peruviana]
MNTWCTYSGVTYPAAPTEVTASSGSTESVRECDPREIKPHNAPPPELTHKSRHPTSTTVSNQVPAPVPGMGTSTAVSVPPNESTPPTSSTVPHQVVPVPVSDIGTTTTSITVAVIPISTITYGQSGPGLVTTATTTYHELSTITTMIPATTVTAAAEFEPPRDEAKPVNITALKIAVPTICVVIFLVFVVFMVRFCAKRHRAQRKRWARQGEEVNIVFKPLDLSRVSILGNWAGLGNVDCEYMNNT